MFKKATVLAAAATGYVLGARAGRGRYEQIKDQVQKVRRDPRVQQATRDAQDYVAEQAPVVKEKAADVAHQASAAAQSAASSVSDTVSEQAPGATQKVADAAGHASDSVRSAVGSAGDKASAVADEISTDATGDDELDGVDLVAANSDVPDPRDD